MADLLVPAITVCMGLIGLLYNGIQEDGSGKKVLTRWGFYAPTGAGIVLIVLTIAAAALSVAADVRGDARRQQLDDELTNAKETLRRLEAQLQHFRLANYAIEEIRARWPWPERSKMWEELLLFCSGGKPGPSLMQVTGSMGQGTNRRMTCGFGDYSSQSFLLDDGSHPFLEATVLRGVAQGFLLVAQGSDRTVDVSDRDVRWSWSATDGGVELKIQPRDLAFSWLDSPGVSIRMNTRDPDERLIQQWLPASIALYFRGRESAPHDTTRVSIVPKWRLLNIPTLPPIETGPHRVEIASSLLRELSTSREPSQTSSR